jgi:hypothetical protein
MSNGSGKPSQGAFEICVPVFSLQNQEGCSGG